MSLIKGIKDRRSIRQYKDTKVPREIMEAVIDATRYTPSWLNLQVARWTLVDDTDMITKIGELATSGLVYNKNSLLNAKGVAILSYVKGVSGNLDVYGLDAKDSGKWETFDAGLACQTFCLAAHDLGVSTCIMGVIEEDIVADIVELPYGEEVAAIIMYGYGENGDVPAPERKPVSEILRFR